MLIRKDLIEIGKLTIENSYKFGCTQSQLNLINDLLYRSSMEIHNYVLDNLYSTGINNIRYVLTSIDANKLIDSLISGTQFKFVIYNSQEWHNFKVEEKKLNLRDYTRYEDISI